MLPSQPRFVYVLQVGGEDRVGREDLHPCDIMHDKIQLELLKIHLLYAVDKPHNQYREFTSVNGP